MTEAEPVPAPTTEPPAPTLKKATCADDIFGTLDRKIIPVEVPEWGCTVHLRELPADEALRLSEGIAAIEEKGNGNKSEWTFVLLEACLCTEAGDRLIPQGDTRLRQRNVDVVMRLSARANEAMGWAKVPPGKAV